MQVERGRQEREERETLARRLMTGRMENVTCHMSQAKSLRSPEVV